MEDYWSKVRGALARRLETFTIYTVGKDRETLENTQNRYTSLEYPAEDLFQNVVSYERKPVLGSGYEVYYANCTYHVTYTDTPVDETIKARYSVLPGITPDPKPTPLPDFPADSVDETALAKAIISGIITPEMTELEKVKAIHDYLG